MSKSAREIAREIVALEVQTAALRSQIRSRVDKANAALDKSLLQGTPARSVEATVANAALAAERTQLAGLEGVMLCKIGDLRAAAQDEYRLRHATLAKHLVRLHGSRMKLAASREKVAAGVSAIRSAIERLQVQGVDGLVQHHLEHAREECAAILSGESLNSEACSRTVAVLRCERR